MAKSLTDEQIATLRSWADAGDELSDIQKKLADEMEVKVTYLETRFLLEDLKIELKPREEPKPEPEPEEDALADPAAPADDPSMENPAPGGDEEVSVTIDQVLRPGALISGQAAFAGGKTMAWWLDQMGQLGVDPADPDFRPNESQLRAFQIALQRKIQESGI